MQFIIKHRYPFLIATSFVSLGIFLISTNPAEVPIGLLTVPIVIFFVLSFCLFEWVLITLKRMGQAPRRRRTVSIVSAAFITVVGILQSTGGLSLADLILLAMILIITAVYINKF
jgi:hypothetical protein